MTLKEAIIAAMYNMLSSCLERAWLEVDRQASETIERFDCWAKTSYDTLRWTLEANIDLMDHVTYHRLDQLLSIFDVDKSTNSKVDRWSRLGSIKCIVQTQSGDDEGNVRLKIPSQLQNSLLIPKPLLGMETSTKESQQHV